MLPCACLFSVVLYVTNVNDEKEHSVDGFIRVDTMLYTGKLGRLVTKHKFDLTLAPKSGTNVYIKSISTDDYWHLTVLNLL